MKTMLASLLLAVPVVLFVSQAAAEEQKSDTIEGEIAMFQCPDFCYLTITDGRGKRHTAMCLAKACQEWNQAKEMPVTFSGKKVRAKLASGKRVDSAGNTIGEQKVFTALSIAN
jgi:hypothetical protein